MASPPVSKKKKFVADGVFYAELNEFLNHMLAEDGYSGVEVRSTPIRTEVIIRATRTREVLGEKGRRIRELTSMALKRFDFSNNTVELFGEKIENKALSAMAQAESVRYKMIGGLQVRRACYGVLRYVMEHGAKGCEVIVSGKLRAQRAKAMKFTGGYMVSTGHPALLYIDSAIRSVKMKQGVLGIKVKLMLPYDPTGKTGPSVPIPDKIEVKDPKESKPFSHQQGGRMGGGHQQQQQQQQGGYDQSPTQGAGYGQSPVGGAEGQDAQADYSEMKQEEVQQQQQQTAQGQW